MLMVMKVKNNLLKCRGVGCMGRKPLVVWAGVLALLMSGCDSLPFFGGNQASDPTPSAATPTTPQGSPIAAGSPMASPRAGASPSGAIGAVPLAPNARPGSLAKPSPVVASAPSGLITTTSPEDALRRSQQGRNDPFALPVSIQPLVKGATGSGRVAGVATAANVPNAPLVQRPIPSLPQIPAPPRAALPIPPAPSPRPVIVTAAVPRANTVTTAARPGTTTAARPGATTAKPGTTTGGATTAGRPGTTTGGATGSTPFVPQLPVLPEPTLARMVQVSGILDVDGAEPRAILKAPNEPTSRYVSPGERLSNGLILVKRIEISGPGGPVVVLEESGVEVIRRIGESSPTTPNQTGAPAA